MATPTADTYTAASGATLQGGRGTSLVVDPPQVAPYQVHPNGMWGNSTTGESVYHHGGSTYIGIVTAGGTVGIAKWNHAASSYTDFPLTASGFSSSDHSAPSIYRRQDGRWLASYSRHNDGEGLRYRVSTTADDISAWGAEQILTASTNLVTYAYIRRVPASGVLLLTYRNGEEHYYRVSNDDGLTWGGPVLLFTNAIGRPYPRLYVSSNSRLDVLLFAGNGSTSLYHVYAEWTGAAFEWRRADGTALSLPINPSLGTLVFSGSTTYAHWTDMRVGPDGALWALLRRYTGTSDAHYAVTKLSGAIWSTPVVVASALYQVLPAQFDYVGDACFDPYTTARIYLSNSASGGGPWELSAYDSADMGATWGKSRDITSGSAAGFKNFRPVAVNGSGPARVAFLAGSYSDLTAFSTTVKLAA